MIVVDTNVIAYLTIPGEFTPLAEEALMKDADWCAPRMWQSEYCSVLSRYVRQSVMSIEESLLHLDDAMELMAGMSYSVDPARVVRLSVERSCSAYDGEFALLAETLDVPLVTSDRSLHTRFPASAVLLSDFVSPTP